MINTWPGAAARGFDDSAVQLWVESLFVFSVVWSVGATGDTEGREAFDTFFRSATQLDFVHLITHPQAAAVTPVERGEKRTL